MITLYVWEILWRSNLLVVNRTLTRNQKRGEAETGPEEDHLKDKLAIVQAQVYLWIAKNDNISLEKSSKQVFSNKSLVASSHTDSRREPKVKHDGHFVSSWFLLSTSNQKDPDTQHQFPNQDLLQPLQASSWTKAGNKTSMHNGNVQLKRFCNKWRCPFRVE